MRKEEYNAPLRIQSKGELMKEPEEVAAIMRLRQLGWGKKRIAAELGMSPNTVKRYLRQGGWAAYRVAERPKTLDGLEDWLKEQFFRHQGNADVVRQELVKEHGIEVSLRTVERACEPWRQTLRAEARATVRFETAPGEQLQIDFGTRTVLIGGVKESVKLFVATLGYSRRMYVRVFDHERQSAWLEGLEGAFRHFGGLTEQVLVDNAKALVKRHDPQTREVEFNERFLAFAHYWGFAPRACAPFRARTKGKDESGVGYVKRNGIAGREFTDWSALEAHLDQWVREVADQRIHGTTGERPVERFAREADALKPLAGRAPFAPIRELRRRVASDACVEIDTNHYSVPWRLIGREVTVQVNNGRVRVLYAGEEVASHAVHSGRRAWVIEREHLKGIVGAERRESAPPKQAQAAAPAPALLRPLSEYEQVIGGGWQ